VRDTARGPGVIRLNWRLFCSLRAFWWLLPFSLAAIVVSSAAPSVFRWYAGSLAGGATQGRIPGLGADLHFTAMGVVTIAVLATGLRIAAWALFEISGMWSSQRIHARMVHALARTRTTFFDENPSGTLINRLVRDYDEVRSTAIIFVGDLLNVSVEILSIAVVTAFASPWAPFLVAPLLAAFSWIQYHRSAMLDHCRSLAAAATGRVFARKTDLIEGRDVFLLYGRGEHLLQRLAGSFREYVQASALTLQIEVWASFWIRFSSELFGFAVLVLTAAALSNGTISVTTAGVVISSLFGITSSLAWLDFATSLVARSSPHVRRVFEFVDLPAEEATERMQAHSPSALHPWRWPETGAIEFVNYTMSYRPDTPVVLDRLNLTLPIGSKTALVGRTGSGKTSVLQALLRMVCVRGGDVRIDGRSIFEVELSAWRRMFGVAPQSPYLFAGTVRTNLDRTGTLPDEVLTRALAGVGLEFGLDHAIVEGGNNLSLGERQLVCLARVIAAGKPVVLMDEPTSGLDPETDARISRVLETALADKTVLTIAHRRESLGRYDRIVEIRNGRSESR
jgi:ABC-type multidrug transport system fused ATPase/permease subunit